ncbi:hypothetical protein EJB05_21623 [Eragrostis curvula]|uniref:Uncharacterized protein n=1 Tax=Eragrostis curvula TaxID=38414 RepID=A0A5J9V3S9_9POAL|nr:hypothetical protein EJB05_21623 [Eragrostis curvula]
MAPTPRSAASMFSEPSIASQLVNPLSHAAYNGDLHLFKKLVRLLELDEGKGSLRQGGRGSIES